MNGEANCVLFHLDGKAFVTLLINMTESTGVIVGMITHRGQTNEGTQHFVATPSELEARWRAPAFTKDILRIVGIRKLDFSTPFHAIMLCPQFPVLQSTSSTLPSGETLISRVLPSGDLPRTS